MLMPHHTSNLWHISLDLLSSFVLLLYGHFPGGRWVVYADGFQYYLFLG
jgi:hypothetical protein